jgi:hypothetical protein
MMEFIKFFNLFDAIEVEPKKSLNELPKVNTKDAILVSETEKKIFGNVFFNIYHQVMHDRYFLKENHADPIGETLKNVENCLSVSYLREGANFKSSKINECPSDYNVYEQNL